MYRPDRLSPPLESVGEVEPQVCTLEHLILWLEKQPAEKEYCWLDSGVCLFGQYAQAMGLRGPVHSYRSPWSVAMEAFNKRYGHTARWITNEPFSIAYAKPHTFGAALSRARNAMASRS